MTVAQEESPPTTAEVAQATEQATPNAYAEILDSKARLASGKHDNGEEITAKTRKKIEAFLAETQLQFDEGMKVYAEKFGPKAAEKLQRYVESQVQKKAALKGGLE